MTTTMESILIDDLPEFRCDMDEYGNLQEIKNIIPQKNPKNSYIIKNEENRGQELIIEMPNNAKTEDKSTSFPRFQKPNKIKTIISMNVNEPPHRHLIFSPNISNPTLFKHILSIQAGIKYSLNNMDEPSKSHLKQHQVDLFKISY